VFSSTSALRECRCRSCIRFFHSFQLAFILEKRQRGVCVDHSAKFLEFSALLLGHLVTKPAIQTLTRTWPMDSRFRGNDDIQDTRPPHCHSRESGNPVLLTESQSRNVKNRFLPQGVVKCGCAILFLRRWRFTTFCLTDRNGTVLPNLRIWLERYTTQS
jgi:hypothetical protein